MHIYNSNIYSHHPDTHPHVLCNMSAPQRRKEEVYLFVFLQIYLMPPLCRSHTTSSRSLFPNVGRDEKQNTFVCTKKKREKAKGGRGFSWWYYSCVRLDFQIVISFPEASGYSLCNTGEGRKPICWNSLFHVSPLLPE